MTVRGTGIHDSPVDVLAGELCEQADVEGGFEGVRAPHLAVAVAEAFEDGAHEGAVAECGLDALAVHELGGEQQGLEELAAVGDPRGLEVLAVEDGPSFEPIGWAKAIVDREL